MTEVDEQRVAALERENRLLRAAALAPSVGVRAKAGIVAARLVDWDEIDDAADEGQLVRALRELRNEHEYLFDDQRRVGSADAGSGRDLSAYRDLDEPMTPIRRLRRAYGRL